MGFDVLVVGEALIELSSSEPLRRARHFRLSFSGDALNAAAAARAAGASVALVTKVGDDELGAALSEYVERLGVDTSLIERVPRPTGMYLIGADPNGDNTFTYLRRDSASTLLAPSDVPAQVLRSARAILVGGIAWAISETAAATVLSAAQQMHRQGGIVVYDPNFRAKLMTAAQAREAFAQMAPSADVVTPSWPREAAALFDEPDATGVAAAVRRAGAAIAAVTMGADGVLLDSGHGPVHYPAVPAGWIVDATGCGDVFAGTVTARLACGDELSSAVELAMASASLSLSAAGGTGYVASAAEARRHLANARPVPRPLDGAAFKPDSQLAPPRGERTSQTSSEERP